MPRSRRHVVPGTAQHLIARFVDRRHLISDERDRALYRERLGRAMANWDWQLLSYALMSSHIHLGAIAGTVPMGPFFKSLHGSYAHAWHSRHKGLGPVLAGRPANFEIAEARVARMIAYHHRNPVAAGIVASPRASRWTSHRYYLRLAAPPPWLDVSRGLDLCGFDDTENGRRQFDEFVRTADLDAAEFRARSSTEAIDPTWMCCNKISWSSLAQCAARAVGLPDHAVKLRNHPNDARLVFVAAARRLGQSHVAIGRALGTSRSASWYLLNRHQVRIEELAAVIETVCEKMRQVDC